MDTVQLSVVVV